MTEFERDFTSEPFITRYPAKAPPPAAPAVSLNPPDAPAAPPAFSAAVSPAPKTPQAAAFASDSPLAPDAYAPPPTLAVRLGRFADLAGAAPTPFALALLAPAGGGKSSALGWIEARIAKVGSGFVRFDAADLAAEPERALAAGFYRALAPSQGALVAAAARDAEDFGADAGSAARAAQDRRDTLQQKLIAERQALADLRARRAALPETVLYDLPGAEVDHFARRMRGGFEARMRRFGFTGDPLLTFKDLTRDLAALDGFRPRLLASLRAVYAYGRQTKLLVYALIFFLLSQGLDALFLHRADWLGWMSRSHDAGAQTADVLRDKLGLLESGATLAVLLALGCLGLNLWRAYGFSAPLLRAAQKLDEDVAARTPESDQAVANQARVVERLAAQTAAAAQQAEAAERRAGAGAAHAPPGFLERDALRQRRDQALGFLHALSDGLKAKNARLTAVVDGFERTEAGGALFERVAGLLARPGLVAIFALDPALCAPETQARLLQLPLRLDADAIDPPAFAPLDAPLSPLEERLLGSLAPLAGDTPRARKRLRNCYAFLRPARGPDEKLAPALAFALAAQLGGGAERAALEALVRNGQADPAGAARLAEFLKIAQENGEVIDAETLFRAAALARTVA